MITNKNELNDYMSCEYSIYNQESHILLKRIFLPSKKPTDLIYRFLKYLRLAEYYSFKHGLKNKILKNIFLYKVGKLGLAANLDIGLNTVGKGITIYHTAGGIVISPFAKVGDFCFFHGNNCIGNDGIHSKVAPVLGNGVHLGVGAVVIGNVYIADNIWIAAGSVVISSFTEPNIIIGGIPARKLKNRIL